MSFFCFYMRILRIYIRMLSGALILGKLFYSFDPSAPPPPPHSKTIESEKTTFFYKYLPSPPLLSFSIFCDRSPTPPPPTQLKTVESQEVIEKNKL